MVELILTDEQAKLLRNSQEDVVLRDPNGFCVGSAQRLTNSKHITLDDVAILAEYRRNQGKPRKLHTTEQVLARLHAINPQ